MTAAQRRAFKIDIGDIAEKKCPVCHEYLVASESGWVCWRSLSHTKILAWSESKVLHRIKDLEKEGAKSGKNK